jgi:hypothetical protein
MKQATALLLLLAAALPAGCDGKSVPRVLLVGGWAPQGGACDSAGGVFYDKEGTWAGYDVVGTWKLSGDRLTTQITERGGYDRPARKVSGEKPTTMTILSLSQTDLTERLADGSTQTLQRCRH